MNTEEHIQEQVARLEATITRQRQEVIALESEIAELHRELDPFEERYNAATQALYERIAAAKAAIRDLEDVLRRQRYGFDESLDDLLKNKADQPPKDSKAEEPKRERIQIKPEKKTPRGGRIKQLYRRLARRYHPDLAENDADREHRTHLMAMINAAYQEGDLAALQALDENKPAEAESGSLQSLAMLKLRQLQQTSADLAVEIEDLKLQRSTLLHSDLMDLKLQEKLIRLSGRDFFKELADDLREEYAQLMARLAQLRQAVDSD